MRQCIDTAERGPAVPQPAVAEDLQHVALSYAVPADPGDLVSMQFNGHHPVFIGLNGGVVSYSFELVRLAQKLRDGLDHVAFNFSHCFVCLVVCLVVCDQLVLQRTMGLVLRIAMQASKSFWF